MVLLLLLEAAGKAGVAGGTTAGAGAAAVAMDPATIMAAPGGGAEVAPGVIEGSPAPVVEMPPAVIEGHAPQVVRMEPLVVEGGSPRVQMDPLVVEGGVPRIDMPAVVIEGGVPRVDMPPEVLEVQRHEMDAEIITVDRFDFPPEVLNVPRHQFPPETIEGRRPVRLDMEPIVVDVTRFDMDPMIVDVTRFDMDPEVITGTRRTHVSMPPETITATRYEFPPLTFLEMWEVTIEGERVPSEEEVQEIIRDDEKPPSTWWGQPEERSGRQYDEDVLKIVRYCLEAGTPRFRGEPVLTVSDPSGEDQGIVDRARATCIALREQTSSDSHLSLKGRDAERFIIGLQWNPYGALNPAYDALKKVLPPSWMASDAGKAPSARGGERWLTHGRRWRKRVIDGRELERRVPPVPRWGPPPEPGTKLVP